MTPNDFLAILCLIGAVAVVFVYFGSVKGLLRRKPNPKDAAKATEKLNALAAAVATPEPLPKPEPPKKDESPKPERTTTELAALEELAMKGGIDTELIKLTRYGRAVIHKGNVTMTPRQTEKDIFIWGFRDMQYYIDFQKIQEVAVKPGRRNKQTTKLKLVYHILYQEPLNEDGTLTWNQELEDILADDAMDQYIQACGYQGRFEWTRTMTIMAIIVVASTLPLGITLNAVFHWIPNTVFHLVR